MTQDLLKFRIYRNEMTYTVMEGLAGYLQDLWRVHHYMLEAISYKGPAMALEQG